MEDALTTGLGLLAAVLTSLSYVSTHDLSLRTLLVLTTGLVLWCVYGLVRADPVIACANLVGAVLAGTVCACKWRDVRNARSRANSGQVYS